MAASVPRKSIAVVPPEDELQLKKMSGALTNVRPFYDDGPDNWDDELIPPALIKEIYEEQFSSPSSGSSTSEESYDSVTESGTVVRRRRKKAKGKGSGSSEGSSEEDEEEMRNIPSISDIEGGIPKTALKNMTAHEIEVQLALLVDNISFVKTENVILERTISRMEKRDREIEAAMPIFTYKYPWENETGSGDASATNSDSDVDHIQQDDGCTPQDGSRGARSSVRKLEKGHADENGDEEEEEGGNKMEKKSKKKRKKKSVVKTKAASIVKELCEWEDSDDEEFDGRYNPIDPNKEISVSQDGFFEGMSPEDRNAVKMYIGKYGNIAPPNYDYMRDKYGKLIQRFYSLQEAVTDHKDKNEEYDEEIRERQKIFDEMEGLGDEDPDFPGFYPRSAKRLPLEYKFKYAEEESEAMERDIMAEKTKAHRRQNAIQVLIDTNVDACDLLNSLNDELTAVVAGAYHPLTKRLMAEKILKFRKALRNKILAEETKITMSLVEVKKTRKKVHEQFKAQQEMGFKLQKIDFEQIRIRNNEYTTRIEGAHEELKGLKLLTAGCFQILKEERQKLTKKLRVHERMTTDINLRETLMNAFQNDLEKFTQILEEVQARNLFMRKRLRAFKVPNSMDYIQLKSVLYELEEEIVAMKHKLHSLEMSRAQKRRQLEALSKMLPPRYLDSVQDKDDWVEMIKKEVEEKNLLSLLTKEELEELQGSKDKSGNSVHRIRNFERKTGKEKYDPEENSKVKSINEITSIKPSRSKSAILLLPSRKSFAATEAKSRVSKKSTTPRDKKSVSKCPPKYRRIPRGHLVIDTREALQMELMTKC